MKRANSWSGLLAMLLLPAALVVLGFGTVLFDLGLVVAAPVAAAFGAAAGVAWAVGGGLTSNVQQPVWLCVLGGVLVGVGAVTAQVLAGSEALGWPVLASVGLGVVGGAPGAVIYALLARAFGRPSISVEDWKAL